MHPYLMEELARQGEREPRGPAQRYALLGPRRRRRPARHRPGRALAGIALALARTCPEAWLYRILTGAFITSYRKRQREPQPTPADGIQDWQPARAWSRPSSGLKPADTEVLDQRADPRVTRALRQLSGDFRTVVCLADVEGYADGEIAGIMGTPIGTVTSRLHRGRRQLRQLLRIYAAARCPATMAGGTQDRATIVAGTRGHRQDR